jgi:hypothetical protein
LLTSTYITDQFLTIAFKNYVSQKLENLRTAASREQLTERAILAKEQIWLTNIADQR